jgi:5'-nucleotidase (lipoprotein e(P4) family)
MTHLRDHSPADRSRAVGSGRAPVCSRFLSALLLGAVMASVGGAAVADTSTANADRPVTAREQLNATLWMQRAAEYRLLAAQTWRMAQEKLASTLVAPGTAALEQIHLSPAALAALPTAIIVDLDETVLDNTAYQARNLLQGAEYDEATWQAWMREASATAVPGAKEFLTSAAAAGHRIIYLTNRRCLPSSATSAETGITADPCPAEGWTQANLRALGLPFADDKEALLLRGERPEWASSDKSTRRTWAAERYRIIALFGDDLHDFVPRADFAANESSLSAWFGERWFVLPNPMYGSWDRALVGDTCTAADSVESCATKTREQRYRALRP